LFGKTSFKPDPFDRNTLAKTKRIKMPKIYDNIENHLTTELNDTIPLSHRTDFCVGYLKMSRIKKRNALPDLSPEKHRAGDAISGAIILDIRAITYKSQ
jgi:hypothetical protein